MPAAWFLAPYEQAARPDGRRGRRLAMEQFTTQIWADNGFPGGNTPDSPEFWSEAECLGNEAVVKVQASNVTLTEIVNTPGFTRLPLDLLDDPLSSLTNGQRNAIRNKLEALGYTAQEISDELGNLSGVTLRQALRFALKRRRKARLSGGVIVLDGPDQPTRPLEDVDAAVT